MLSRQINYAEESDSESIIQTQNKKVGRPFASLLLRSKNYNERFDVLHKTIIRAVLKWFSKTYRLTMAKQIKEINCGFRRKYNRSNVSKEEFESSTSLFSAEFIKNREILILSNNMDFSIFEFYIRIMVDRKLAKRFYSKGDFKSRVLDFCTAVDNYNQTKFIELMRNPEVKTIFEILLKGNCMNELFQTHNKIKNNKSKYKEAFDKLMVNFDS